jgi:hypothetical protein
MNRRFLVIPKGNILDFEKIPDIFKNLKKLCTSSMQTMAITIKKYIFLDRFHSEQTFFGKTKG